MLNVPSNWNTGIYLAKFTDAAALQWYVPFDVRGNAHALYVIVTLNTTFTAYNAWGGYSLYEGRTRIGIGNLPQGVKVSLDRPDIQDHGSAQVLYGMAPAIHWLEHQGYDLSYMSDVDLQEDPTELLQHRAYLSVGHDEYWTKEMRDGVEHALNSGVGLAFLGGNDIYWQIRFEPNSAALCAILTISS